jgi:hypothetical protein
MADGLADLGSPVEDRILILNILRWLNQRFENIGSIIRRYSPFLNFLKVQDDLLLEEIHMHSTGPLAIPTTLYTNAEPPAPTPPPSTPSCPPNGDNGGNRKNNNKNRNSGNGGGHNGKNNNVDGGRGGSSNQTTAPTGSDGRTPASTVVARATSLTSAPCRRRVPCRAMSALHHVVCRRWPWQRLTASTTLPWRMFLRASKSSWVRFL